MEVETTETNMQKTPLYDRHIAMGGRMVPFAGFYLPVQYGTGVIAEHMAVRQTAGLFDVSHMGELLVSGADALENLERLMTNEIGSLAVGRARCSVMCYVNGGCVDDLIVYRMEEEAFLLVVNACNHHKDAEWIRRHLTGEAKLTDISAGRALMSLQGPASRSILEKLASPDELPQGYYTFKSDVNLAGVPAMVARTGYTGELGFEIFTAADQADALLDRLLDAGTPFGMLPCGLGARDTLRLEAAMPLYGHETCEEATPVEAGLGRFVRLEKPDFIGKASVERRLETGPVQVGLRVTGRGIAREHQTVLYGGEPVGAVTSGTFCPYLSGAYALARVDRACSKTGTAVEIDVRGRKVAAEVVPLPFYKRAEQ